MIKAGPTCIIRTPQFKAKAKELNISEDALARIAYGYQNQEGGKSFPSDSYITEVHNVKNYVTADELKGALAIWESKYADEMIGNYEDINALSIEAQEYFDSRAIGIKPLYDGQFQLIINKPEVGEYKETAAKKETSKKTVVSNPKTEHERFVANQTALSSQIAFEPSTHTYKIGGKQADYSVTELKDMLLGREKPQRNMYLEISSRLGTTYDNIARDYFADTLQKSYPNVSTDDLQIMKDGLGTLKRQINKRWPGSTIITDENLLRVAGIVTVNGQQYSVAGTMDMVVIDKNGVVHVLDFKTHRANNDAELSQEAKNGYATQVTLYRELLKAQGYKVDDDNGIVQFNLEYESPNTYQYQLASSSTDLQVKVLLDGELVNIQDAIAQAGIGGKRIYKGASFHGAKFISIEMSEVGVTRITPITTPEHLSKQTTAVAKQTRVSESVSQKSARTISKVTPVVFKGSYHALSNMADKPFTIKGSDGKERTFKSVEQYYQWAKAITAGKYSLANRILASKNPYQIRKIGEDMGMTDAQEKEWSRKKRAVMKKAMRAAFEQNESAMNSLVESKTTFKAEKEEPFFAELLMELREEFGGVKAPTKRNNTIENIPEFVYHYSNEEGLTAFTQKDNNYFSKFKGGTKNAIFFTDNPSPKSGTVLDRKVRYKVQLSAAKIKVVYGTKDEMHAKGSSYTEEVNKAEKEGYDAVRFVGLDDNQEFNQNVTVIFNPRNARIVGKDVKNNKGQFNTTTTKTSKVTRIISGGQTGVDTIGLQVAKALGIETGGTAPKGFLREDGIDQEDITTYGLQEITDEEQQDYTSRTGKKDAYTGRTELNVRNSDGTVYFGNNDDSAGKIATERAAKEWKKPFLYNPTAKELQEWIRKYNIATLNIAGNRGSKIGELGKQIESTLKEALSSSSTGVEVHKGYWTRAEVEQATDKVFLFGDNTNDRVNTHYIPSSTQAVIRGLSNAIGIDTKKDRGTSESSYFTDDDFEQFKTQVDDAIQSAINSGKTIVLPEDGIGTGKAELEKRAPKLFSYLQEKLQSLQSSKGTKAESLSEIEGRIRLDEDYQVEEQQVPSTDVQFDSELIELETISTEGSIYTAEYNMVLKKILGIHYVTESTSHLDLVNSSKDRVANAGLLNKDNILDVKNTVDGGLEVAIKVPNHSDFIGLIHYSASENRWKVNLQLNEGVKLQDLSKEEQDFFNSNAFLPLEYQAEVIDAYIPKSLQNYMGSEEYKKDEKEALEYSNSLQKQEKNTTEIAEALNKGSKGVDAKLRDKWGIIFFNEFTGENNIIPSSSPSVDVHTIDITKGSYDQQIAKLLTSRPISSIIRLGVEQGVPNPNVMYLMEMMMEMGYNPIYTTEENSVTFEKDSISDLYASNLKHLNYNKKTHTLRLPVAFTYGKTNEEIKKSAQRDILFGSPLFTPKQLRTISKGIIYQLSHMISQIQGNVNGYEVIMGEQSDIDFTKMSRIDIIRTIGLSTLLDKVKSRVFSSSADDKTDTRKRKKLIRDNWQAMLDLGYDTLIGLEEISLTTKSNSTEDIKNELNDMMGEDDEQTLQELFGSAIEHWQVGFRQVSAFSSLSQTIKRFMDKLYVLDSEGQQIEDEFGLAEHLSAQEAVAHILSWTQGAQSLDDRYEDGTYKSNSMLAMLKSKVDQAPWVTQVIEALEGKRNDEGELISKPNEEFRSQFFSNFAKYFQKYTITFKDKNGNILIKTINEDQYSDIAIGESQAKENGFALGYFKLRNTDGSINKANMSKLVKLNTHLQKLVEDVSKTGELSEVVNLSDLHATISGMLDILDITTPVDEILWATFGTKKSIKEFAKKVNFLIDGTSNTEGIATSEAIANNTKAITNVKDYQDLVKMVVANMGTDMESVSYEAGKMYYSYVTPSYLGRLVTKLRSDHMSDEEYREFIENEYLRYEWFQKTKAREITAEDGTVRTERVKYEKPRCYWLRRLISSKQVRENFTHQVSLHFLGDEYTDKTPAAYIASMVKAFLYDNERKWAYYRVPMQSNKPSEDYLKFERIHDDYENVIVNHLVDVFNQEYDRIQAVKERKEAGAPKKSFDKFGNRFAFLDWVNQYRKGTEEYNYAHTNFTEDEQRFSELLSKYVDGEELLSRENGEYFELIDLFKELSKKAINKEYEVAKKQWIDEGFITLNNKGKISKVYAGMKVTEEELREFYWNDMFAAINILELTVTDIAYYKDTEDLQKRLAQIHAPGMRANLSAKDSQGRLFTDGKHRVLTIQDDVVASDIIPNLRKAFDNILEKTSDEKEYMRLWQQFNDIIDSLKEVNFADAQGFTTPTAYRKKMGIFGKWRENIDEPAYQALMKLRRGEKLAEGEKLSDYIAVLWQPLKPFIYTQIYKDGYVTDTNNAAMPNFKEGRQIKDSEFCLVLADALTRAGGQKSVLNAIFDFMEDTLNTTTGEPNGEGIDTIVFESTQKAVKPVILNLNGKTYEEAKAELEATVIRNQDGSLWYDEDYVDVMDFADYAIQQEIPVHFIGHKQAQGSQDRILCWADIRKKDREGNDNMIEMEIDGVKRKITVAAAQERYFDAVANNISMSTKAVIERFNLKAVDPRLRNIALSRILQDAILKDSRFGADLLWACDTNKYGEFNIPLSDPTQSNRIQQLLNSIIKNEINKQEITGGPVVQVSSWGRSKKLHIRYQTEDKFDDNGILIEAGKILLSEGEFNGTEELPRGYETKFKSKEGYTSYKDYIAGQHKTAYYEVVIPIQNYSIAQDFMDENGVVDIEAMEAMNPKLLQAIGYRIPTEAKYSMVPMRIVGFTDANSGEGAMLPAEITWQSGSDFDIDKLYIMTFALNRVKEGNHYIYVEPEKGTRQYNDNIIIETQLAILTSNLVTDQFYTPGNFEEPKKYGYQISYVQSQIEAIQQEIEESGITKEPKEKAELLKDRLLSLYKETSTWSNTKLKDANKTAKNLIFNQTQVQFHKQNMTAGKLIGIFAQANVSHAFISLRDEDKDCFLWIPEENEFEIDGIKVANFSDEYGFLVDPIDARNGKRVSSYLASLLAASADAVKDPILNLININQETANLVTSMLRMGFSLETVSLLCSQPVFRAVVRQYNLRNAQRYTTLNTIIEEFEMLLPTEVLEIEDIKVTNESLVANLAGQDNVTNYMVLEIVKRMQDISNAFRDITHMTRYNSITSAVGPFATDTMLSTMQDDAFLENPMISAGLRKAVRNRMLKYFRLAPKIVERQLLGRNMIQAQYAMFNMLQGLHIMLARENSTISSSIANAFSDFFMSYYIMNFGKTFDLSLEHRKYMLQQFPEDFNALKSKYKDNVFLSSVQFIKSNREEFPFLRLKTRGLSGEAIEDFKQAWVEAYENPETRDIAIRLVEYAFFRGGFGFNPKTFMNLVPNVVKAGLKGYISSLNNNCSMTCVDVLSERILRQFILHHTELISGYYPSIDKYEHTPISDVEVVVSRDPIDKKTSKKDNTRLSTKQPFLFLGDDLYYITDRDIEYDTYTLTKVDALGGNGQGFEISTTEDFPTTIYSKPKRTEYQTSRGHTSNTTSKLNEETIGVLMDALFEDEELENLGSAMKVRDAINDKLLDNLSYQLPKGASATRMITKVLTSIKGMSASEAREMLNKARKTINDLNLCD